jgi:hypothetical protein
MAEGKLTVTVLSMKTAGAFAQQSKLNAALRAEIVGLRADVAAQAAQIERLLAHIESAPARVMKAKVEPDRITRKAWDAAVATLQAEQPPKRMFQRAEVLAKAAELANAPKADNGVTYDVAPEDEEAPF